MRLNSFFFILLLCFFFPRCEEEEAFELPEFSTSGKNTFGCYVDKELFVYTRGSGVLGHSPISGYYSEGGKYMDFYSYANKDRSISITDSIVKVGFKHKVSSALYKINKEYYRLYLKFHKNILHIKNHLFPYYTLSLSLLCPQLTFLYFVILHCLF